MAGWDDSIFGNLPLRRLKGLPPQPTPPPARGLSELTPVNPAHVAGGLYDLYAQGVGNAVGYGASHGPLDWMNAPPAPQGVQSSADLLGRDVTGMLQSPKEHITPTGAATAIAAAPVAIPAAKTLAKGVEDVAPAAGDVAAAAAKAAPPLIAYHGSPADFDKFSNDFLATGEGSNAYGQGLYFAQNEDVARSYRERLAKGFVDKQGAPLPRPIQDALEYVHPEYKASDDLEAGVQDAISRLQDQADFYRKAYGAGPNLYDSAVERLKTVDPNDLKPAGHMYQVGINSDPTRFLDWDKTYGEHDPGTQDAISHLMFKNDVGGPYGKDADQWLQQNHPTGQQIYNRLSNFSVDAQDLQAAGIPGIKYLDQGSRAAGEGTSNYVVFDPATIEILKKYGLAGALAPVGAGAATLSVLGQPGQGTTLNTPPPDQQQFY